jgi:predicted thioesterase
VRIGDAAAAALLVGPEDSAKALSLSSHDDFPDVLATFRMIALMELAAARVMRGLLTAGQHSVGVGVCVRHLAATPVDVEVRASATFLGMQDRLYRFKVQAFDPGGLIGEGEHTRAIVSTNRLISRARTRMAAAETTLA